MPRWLIMVSSWRLHTFCFRSSSTGPWPAGFDPPTTGWVSIWIRSLAECFLSGVSMSVDGERSRPIRILGSFARGASDLAKGCELHVGPAPKQLNALLKANVESFERRIIRDPRRTADH